MFRKIPLNKDIIITDDITLQSEITSKKQSIKTPETAEKDEYIIYNTKEIILQPAIIEVELSTILGKNLKEEQKIA